MAIECTPQALTTAAGCFNALIPNQLAPLNTYLLAQIWLAADPMADISVPAVMAGAKCFAALTPNQQFAMQTYLLCQIAVGGGGGGGTPQVFSGSGPPAGLQPGQSALLASIYIDTDPGGLWYDWPAGAAGWQ